MTVKKFHNISILHNQPVPQGNAFSEASLDVLTQVEAIEHALSELGHPFVRIPFTKEAGDVFRRIQEEEPKLVINLCESVDEDPRYCGHPAAMLELLGIPFSGSPSSALTVTTDKVISKRLLAATGIATPAFRVYEGSEIPDLAGLHFPVIVKPRLQDASIGIDQDSIFRDAGSLLERLKEFYDKYGDILIEEFIAGREFNISLFGYPEPEILPIAEITFDGFPQDMFQIVGYRAKWDTSSFEYQHTPRVFPKLPREMERRLQKVARESFRLFMLRDYGRVDVRVDAHGRIFVLEVNANPCLSPDAGFPAAAGRAGISYTRMVEQLLAFVQKRAPQ